MKALNPRTGDFEKVYVKALDSLEIGTILPYAGTTAPTSYMMCYGDEISRTTYSKLFEKIGTKFGSGDGSTTFNLPDLRGRTIIGLDGRDTDFDTVGKTGGSKTHTLTIEEIPEHDHFDNYYDSTQAGLGNGSNEGIGYNYTWNSRGTRTHTGLTGGGQPHNIMNPHAVVNYIIKVAETTPRSSETVNTYSESTKDAYACDYINKLHSYSIEEQRIGTWINNKPLYRKVIDVGYLPNNSSSTINSGLTNVLIHKMYGTARNASNSTITLPEANGGNSIRLVFNTSNQVEITTTYDRSAFYGYIVLEYTKTTD